MDSGRGEAEPRVSVSYGKVMSSYSNSVVRLPTARHTEAIDLRLLVNGRVISGETVAKFLVAVFEFIVKKKALARISVPFRTTGQNYLLAKSPVHPSTRPFANFRQVNVGGQTLFLNTNHPRFFALRQGYELLRAAGFCPSLPPSRGKQRESSL